MLARSGGWRALSGAYGPAGALPLTGWTEKRAVFTGRARYKNVLRLQGDPKGLLLSVAWPFRFGHPPLLIPWEDVFTVTSERCAPGWSELRFRRVTAPSIMLPSESIEGMTGLSHGQWRGH